MPFWFSRPPASRSKSAFFGDSSGEELARFLTQRLAAVVT